MTILLAFLLAAAAQSPEVVNAGFEDIDQRSSAPRGWSFTSLPNQSHLVRYEATDVPAGGPSRALSISVAPNHPEQTVAYNAHQDVPGVVAGQKYRIAAKVQTRGLRTLPMLVVQCLDRDGTAVLAFARTPARDLNADLQQWEQVQAEVTVPEGTSTFRLRIGISSQGNAGGTALIDDVSVVEVK